MTQVGFIMQPIFAVHVFLVFAFVWISESAENTHFGICQGQSYLLTKTQKVNISDASNACDHYQTQLASFGNISGDEFKDRLADCTITEKMVASEYYFVTGAYCCIKVLAGGRKVFGERDCRSCPDTGFVLCEGVPTPYSFRRAMKPTTRTLNRCQHTDTWVIVGNLSICLTDKSVSFCGAFVLCNNSQGKVFKYNAGNIPDEDIVSALKLLGLNRGTAIQLWVSSDEEPCAPGYMSHRPQPALSFTGHDFNFTKEFVLQTTTLRVLCEKPYPPPATTLATQVSSSHPTIAPSPTLAKTSVTPVMVSTLSKSSNVTTTLQPTNMDHFQPSATSTHPQTPWSDVLRWTKIGNREFYVNCNKHDFANAATYCRRMTNASLAAFSDVTMYFRIIAGLSLEGDSFWVDDPIIPGGKECLVLDVDANRLMLTRCDQKLYSICSRSVYDRNETLITESDSFKKLIQDMTVEKQATSRSHMRKVSADDKRKTAKASGAIAIVTIIMILSLLVWTDVSHLISGNGMD